jgi:hypothetical protein
MAWASNLQKEKQNRRDSMCWEKIINFVFYSRASNEVGASFSLYWKEARADFLFQREKRIFWHFLITFESLWRSRWIFFWLNRTEEKRLHFRDLSVANNDEKKFEILNRWKKREQKKLLSEFHSSALWKIMIGNLWISRWGNKFFFIHSDVHAETY